MQQVSRTLTDADDGVLRAHRVMICDRIVTESSGVAIG
jgi:hypothetical protein